jgi:hypothetical protein
MCGRDIAETTFGGRKALPVGVAPRSTEDSSETEVVP